MAVAKIKTIEKDFDTRLCSEVLYTVLSKVLVALLCLAVTAHRREWWHGPVGEKGVIVRQLPTDFPSGRTRGVEAVRLAFEI